jgi:hypothetical protein
MSQRPDVMRNFHAAQDEFASFNQPVRVETVTDAH